MKVFSLATALAFVVVNPCSAKIPKAPPHIPKAESVTVRCDAQGVWVDGPAQWCTLTGLVNSVSVGGGGWVDEKLTAPDANSPTNADWASQQAIINISGVAFEIDADVAPGAFAAMVQILTQAKICNCEVSVLAYEKERSGQLQTLRIVQTSLGQ